VPKVYLGMSGGVDSSVSAILLQEQGYEVIGCYMKNWSKDLPGAHCPWAEDLADAKRVATKLGIDFKVFDFESQYKQKVVDYMISEYRAGRTPNPDIMCNQEIKFKLFYDIAIGEGADFVATGHYAQIIDGKLAQAVDTAKDQTYFLARMPREALAKTLFPVGHLKKSEVKQIASDHNLTVASKKESMGICFVGEVDIRQFLKQYIKAEAGPIIDAVTNERVGTHEGVPFYTIGQRHGLYLASDLPYYVIRKDIDNNTLYVSKDLNAPELWSGEVTVKEVDNGLLRQLRATGEQASETGDDRLERSAVAEEYFDVLARVRHRAPLIPVTLKDNTVRFNEPQKALSPGQFIVFYQDNFVVGSAVIA